MLITMANFCSIVKSPKYQRTKQCVSTENYKTLDVLSDYYMDTVQQLPEMDELSFTDSSSLLKKNLNLVDDVYTTPSDILEYTNTQSLDEALVKLNTELHPDLDIQFTPVSNIVAIHYKRRPHKANGLPSESLQTEEQSQYQKQIMFQDMLYDIATKLGIQFKYITNEELSSDSWKNLVGDAKLVNAFVYNGDVYINTDNASVDSKLHELTHILLGNIRFINPELYISLLSEVGKLPNISKLANQYLDRTQSDILEEVLTTEFSKYITGKHSLFDSLSRPQIHRIDYYMLRCLDTMINGDYSVSALNKYSLGEKSLLSLSKDLWSPRLENMRSGRGDYSYIHRVVNNEKTKLFKSKDLIEEC